MMIRISLVGCLALAALLTLPTVAVSANAALGDRGELYVAKTGAYGDLFPDAETGIPADRPVLAIDVFAAGEPMRRLLVPDSEGPDVERSPRVGFEAASRTLYVIWESQREPTVSALYLSGLRADEWSEPIEISGDIAPLKGPPQVEIASETYVAGFGEEEEPIQGTRTLFHVVWWEQAGPTDEVYYAPVLLDDGAYLGWNPVIRLNAFAGPEASGDAAREAGRALLRAPRLESGRDIRSSTIGFADARARKFVTLEARLLPAEVGRIADDLRAQIIDIGRSDDPEARNNIHRELRAQIIEIGRELNPGVVHHFADKALEAYDALAAAHPDLPDAAFGDKLRAQIIDIGARLLSDLDSRRAATASHVVELDRARGGGADPETQGGGPELTHLVEIRTVTRRPIPPVGDGPVEIFVSEDGLRSLVSWRHQGKVLYTETVEGPERSWTAPKALALGDEIRANQLESILRSRVSRRP